MKLTIKNITFLLSVLLVTSAVHAQKNMRVGYIDMHYILENVEEYKIANEQFAQQVEQWNVEIKKRQTAIDSEKAKLEAEKSLLTPELIKDKEEEIALMEYNLNSYQQKKFGADNGEFITQKFMLVKPIQDQIFNTAQEIGKLKKYDYIFEKDEVSVLFSNERHDLSNLVLRVINKKHNAEDRNKDIAELLKENYNYEIVDEKAQKRVQLEKERQERIEEQQRLREERRQQVIKEREERLKAREDARKKTLDEREKIKKNN